MLLPSSQCETHSPGSLVHAEGPAARLRGTGVGGGGREERKDRVRRGDGSQARFCCDYRPPRLDRVCCTLCLRTRDPKKIQVSRCRCKNASLYVYFGSW